MTIKRNQLLELKQKLLIRNMINSLKSVSYPTSLLYFTPNFNITHRAVFFLFAVQDLK